MSTRRNKPTLTPPPVVPAVLSASPVAFVGAGPGDPGLLTVRAHELLREADVVVVDAREAADLEAVTALARPGACTVVDGVDAAGALVESSRAGRRVVRLVAGDPFAHPAAVGEALACAHTRVAFEVVPGVAPLTGVPTYAGIPLAAPAASAVGGVLLCTVEADAEAVEPVPAEGVRTVVVAAAADRLTDVVAAFDKGGWPPDTSVAATRSGTTSAQSTLVTTLGALVADAQRDGLVCPGGSPGGRADTGRLVLVAGEGVAARTDLSWYETKPLFGWRVLVPRTKEQAGAVSAQLRRYGAVPEEVPTISVEPPRTPHQMDKAVRGMVEGRYEWVAFTSVNALRAVREKFAEYGLDARAFSGLKVAVVGERTAAALRAWGIEPDLVPSGEQSARGLLADWPPYDEILDPINRVLLPRADIATDTLVAGLTEAGWEVDDVTAYRTVRAAPPPAPVREAIKTGEFDAVLFTSSSTVRNLIGIAGKPHPATVVACIGPATARTAEELGLRVDVLADSPSVEALVAALAGFGAAQREAALASGSPVRPSQRRAAARRRSH